MAARGHSLLLVTANETWIPPGKNTPNKKVPISLSIYLSIYLSLGKFRRASIVVKVLHCKAPCCRSESSSGCAFWGFVSLGRYPSVVSPRCDHAKVKQLNGIQLKSICLYLYLSIYLSVWFNSGWQGISTENQKWRVLYLNDLSGYWPQDWDV